MPKLSLMIWLQVSWFVYLFVHDILNTHAQGELWGWGFVHTSFHSFHVALTLYHNAHGHFILGWYSLEVEVAFTPHLNPHDILFKVEGEKETLFMITKSKVSTSSIQKMLKFCIFYENSKSWIQNILPQAKFIKSLS